MRETPGAEEFARELAAGAEPWFWLDGAAAPSGEQGVSLLGRASEIVLAEPGREQEFLELLRSRAPRDPRRSRTSRSSHPFRSGWVVALGYEFGVRLLGLDTKPDDVPPAFALRVDEVRAIHHGLRGASDPASDGRPVESPWRSSPESYMRQVEECREAIHRGDAYVLCLTDTAELDTEIAPLALYERLRAGGIATRGAVISTGDRALVSASPERFLTVRGRRVSTHPIKGTRRRGATAEEDAELAAELAADPKERAENLMIVDLMRNDLSRVCAPESVRVDRFLDVETHPRVHQLVSTVTGELRDGLDVFDALAACFPGGSMTGAPKRSAVSILGGLEAGPRGLYSGCFGWIDDSGDAELAMTIRGAELRGGGPRRRAFVGAGGGITADSDPARELAERDLKAAAVLAALR